MVQSKMDKCITPVPVRDAALFLISLDPNRYYFNKKLISLNGADFYEGNARLNKILHLAQNIYLGRTGEKLIDADFYAYANGAVVLDIQENYSLLLGTCGEQTFSLSEFVQEFLGKAFNMFKDAPIERLIEIDHEDPAWQEKRLYTAKNKQKMNSIDYVDEYKEMYEAANFYMDGMEPVWE